MLPIPEWAKEAIHTSACIPCDHVYRDADVTGLGMRHVGDGRVCFCVEVRCPRCHRQELLAVLTKPMDIRSFIAEIAELGQIEDYREWAIQNATLRFYPEPEKNRLTAVHHLHTDGEGWADPRYTELRLCSSLEPLGIKMKVAGMRTVVGEAHLDVLGGYASNNETVVLYRHGTVKIPVYDGALKIDHGGYVLLRGFESDSLEPPDWATFERLAVGTTFRLGGRAWKKLTPEELRVQIGDKRWVVKKKSKRR